MENRERVAPQADREQLKQARSTQRGWKTRLLGTKWTLPKPGSLGFSWPTVSGLWLFQPGEPVGPANAYLIDKDALEFIDEG